MTDTERDQTYIAHMIECIQRIENYANTDEEELS